MLVRPQKISRITTSCAVTKAHLSSTTVTDKDELEGGYVLFRHRSHFMRGGVVGKKGGAGTALDKTWEGEIGR